MEVLLTKLISLHHFFYYMEPICMAKYFEGKQQIDITRPHKEHVVAMLIALIIKHCKNRKTLPREHIIGFQSVKMFLLKDPFKVFFFFLN